MIFSPAWRAATSTFAVGAIAFWAPEISTPARSNMPPLAAKSFSISTTRTALRTGSIEIGSGFASMLIISCFDPLAEHALAKHSCPPTLAMITNLNTKPGMILLRLTWWILLKLRQVRIHVVPGLRVGNPHIHFRFEQARIVQAGSGNALAVFSRPTEKP